MARKAKTPKIDHAAHVRELAKMTIEQGENRIVEIGKKNPDPVLVAEAAYWKASIDHETAILHEMKAWGDDPDRQRERPANPKGWVVAMETLTKTLPRVLRAYDGWQGYVHRKANPSMEVIELFQPIIADNLDALGMFNLSAKDKKFTSNDIARTLAEVIAQDHIHVADVDMGVPPLCQDCDA